MKTLCIVALALLSFQLVAHSPSETHTQLFFHEEELEIWMELPWSITEELKKENPNWDENTPREIVFQALVNFVHQHFNVIKSGEVLVPSKVEEIDGTHTHSVRLKMIFPITDPDGIEIRNTILFDRYENQENYHVYMISEDVRDHATTSHGKPTFRIETVTFHRRTLPHRHPEFPIGPPPKHYWLYVFGAMAILTGWFVWKKFG